MYRVNVAFFWSCIAAMSVALTAHAGIEAGTENACVNIYRAAKNPPLDPDTTDKDENGIIDRAHFRLLDAVLRDDNAPHHTLILAAWTLNYLQILQDNTLRNLCPLLPRLYGFTCDDVERYAAGLVTIADPKSIAMAQELLRKAGITINLDNYTLVGEAYLAANGDLDGDAFTNLQEYTAVCANFDGFVTASFASDITPVTLPCCRNCPPLSIVTQPSGGERYTGDSFTFTVQAAGGEGYLHYQWYRGTTQIGLDSPVLELNSLLPLDTGSYYCEVRDNRSRVTSRPASLTVADHLSFTTHPQSATVTEGGSVTFSVSVRGGLGSVTFTWLRNDVPVATGATLRLSRVRLEDAGVYVCRANDRYETVTSNPAVLEVLPRTPEGEGGMEGIPEGEGTLEGFYEGGYEGVSEGEGMIEGQIEGGAEGEGSSEGIVEGEPTEGEGEILPFTLTPTSETVRFGMVVLGGSREMLFRVTNTSNEVIEGAAGLVDNTAFVLASNTQFTLGPGDFATLPVVFSPKRRGYYTDILVVRVEGRTVYRYLSGRTLVVPRFNCRGESRDVADAAASSADVTILGVGLLALGGLRRRLFR